ncbi:hypothetical protein MNBD_DELTA01-1679, partial [hydrothermal vent metagenome]
KLYKITGLKYIVNDFDAVFSLRPVGVVVWSDFTFVFEIKFFEFTV